MYFNFAGVTTTSNGTPTIAVAINTDRAVLVGKEVGVKISVGGHNVPTQPLNFRLKLEDSGSISIEPWEVNKPAVGTGEVDPEYQP
jgi:hypothetical protein